MGTAESHQPWGRTFWSTSVPVSAGTWLSTGAQKGGGRAEQQEGPPGSRASFCSWENWIPGKGSDFLEFGSGQKWALNPRGQCYFRHTGTPVKIPERLPNRPRRIQAPDELTISSRHSRPTFPTLQETVSHVPDSLIFIPVLLLTLYFSLHLKTHLKFF